ncbi:MAG TPA: hypothetical protein GXX19_09420 [Syntrophomonadaceae bacterium]|nr:hypothetical protein [Syntrophomonadaceae bacterium]
MEQENAAEKLHNKFVVPEKLYERLVKMLVMSALKEDKKKTRERRSRGG